MAYSPIFHGDGSIALILYIAGEAENATRLKVVMEKHGYHLDTASTAGQGLVMSATTPYEVVIQELHLPDMAGIDACKKLLLDNPERPTIVLIEKNDQKMMGEAMDIGVSQYVIKDDSLDYLEILPNIVSSLMRRKTRLPPGTSNEVTGLFSTLAQEAPIGIFFAGPDGISRYANKALARTTGYSVEELVGSLWHTKIHPEDREAITENWLSKANTTEPWQGEFRFQGPDGSVARVVGLTNPLFDSQDKVIGHVGTISDITERQRVAKELEETLATQNAILSNIDEGVSLSGADGQIIAYNQRYLEINDFPPELLKNGAVYKDLVRFNAERGYYGAGDIDELVADRLARIDVSEGSTSRKVFPGGRVVETHREPLVDGRVVITDRDITLNRAAEERLVSSEERYRQIANVSSDWVWELDANLRFSYLSEGYQRITGNDPKRLLGKTRFELAAQEELKKPYWHQHLADLEAHREFRDFQYQTHYQDSELRTIRISGVPVFEKEGAFKGYRGTATDVTDRVADQENLAENTEMLRHAVALGKLGHYVWDGMAKKTLSCTEEYARIHGVSVEEYMAITDSLEALTNWIHPDDYDYYLNEIKQAMARQSNLELEYRIIARDGRIRHVREIFDPTYDDNGQLVQTAGAMQDITESKEVEQALKDAERLASLGNWRWSIEENRLLSCSEGFARVYGIPMDEVSDYMSRPGVGVIQPEDRDRVEHNFSKAMEDGFGYEIEYRIVRPDGEIRDIQEIGETIVNTEGQNRELKGTIQDITERKSVEREISKAKTEAETANQAKSEFLSSMSHELRTPLSAILGFAQIMEVNTGEPLTESQKRSVKHIINGGQHLLKLITEVLDFAKIETGEIKLSIEPIDLDYVLPDCISIASALAGPRNISVIDNISEKDLPPVNADETRLKQVLLNLISNGVKYNRDGGTLALDAEVRAGQVMRISVMDTGYGIRKEDYDQVFEAFDRLGREAMDIEGTGIGLTISKQLIELMHGRINFSSIVDEGSTFWIEIPLASLL